MLFWLLDWLYGASAEASHGLAKITLRASLAAVVSFVLGVTLGPHLIAWLKRRFREPNTSPSPEVERLHRTKHFTPTMGGLFIIGALLGSCLLFGDLTNPFLLLSMALVVGLMLLGIADDLAKLARRSRGVSPRTKLTVQVALASLVAIVMYNYHQTAGSVAVSIPLTSASIDLGWWYVPLAVLVLVGTSNAVNLTDGLDGLAGGCLVFAFCGMGIMAYASGHAELAAYLRIFPVPGSGEMLIVAGGVVGGLLSFLWFNCHPAQVFMGDTGSLPLGGLLGFLAVVSRNELLLLVIGGVFVAEAASVMIQIAYFRWKRRRVFLCAPLHHHFQFKGWPENQIVVRFWIASALCTIVGVASLKTRIQDPPAGDHPNSIALTAEADSPAASPTLERR
jgi:phospho-N-acetylmuramoyl-pentapeptide-transferase